MAQVTITLPDSAYEQFSGRSRWDMLSLSLGIELSESGQEQILTQVSMFVDNSFGGVPPGQIIIRVDSSGNPDDFTTQMENSGTITFVASDNDTLVVTSISDSSDPYLWVPVNSTEVIAFANHVRGLNAGQRSLQVTFNDNAVVPSFADDTGNAQSWTQNTAITPVTVPAANGTPSPTYTAVGSPPAGIAFNTTTRVLSGTPTATGSGTITIRATNSTGSDDWTVAYTTAATVPAQPTGLAATATHGTVSLTWNDPGDATITSYQILRRDISGGGSMGVHVDSVPAGISYDDITNVEPSNTYSYRIKARNAHGLSGQSGFIVVTTSARQVRIKVGSTARDALIGIKIGSTLRPAVRVGIKVGNTLRPLV